jgi:phosphopantetheinyl transferase
MERSTWNRDLLSTSVASQIQVVQDALGKPHLLVGEDRGPAISFCECGGAVWAALSGDQSDIGIDLAAPDEFQGHYPVYRVFQAQEFHHAMRLTAGNVEQASALLWSVKEAVVKALGCGFHRVEPLDICMHTSTEEDGQYTFQVRLSSKARARLPMGAGRSIWVRTLPQAGMWLSIAFLNGPRRHGDGRECHNVLACGRVDV